jgi:hypothetical protein
MGEHRGTTTVYSLLLILCFRYHFVVLWPIGPLSGPFIVTVGYHASQIISTVSIKVIGRIILVVHLLV